ncbi:MAG: hypothetical protein D6820_15865 [Lentisphaerae bacterium]|nr:MAG: hypothetical protein D6820_15865 [Lentisphaerota bacterium]
MNVLIAVALSQEARALNSCLAGKTWQVNNWLTCREAGDFTIATTGSGGYRMAAALGYMFAVKSFDCAVNIGIAGHYELSRGVWEAVKVRDCVTGQDGYPDINQALCFPLAPLFSVPVPATRDDIARWQLAPGLVDMEGAAFFFTASRFLPCHRIRIIKIAVDPLRPREVSAQDVYCAIEDTAPCLIENLKAWVSMETQRTAGQPAMSELETWLDRYLSGVRLTESMHHEICKLLYTMKATTGAFPDESLLSRCGERPKTKQELRSWFRELKHAIRQEIFAHLS